MEVAALAEDRVAQVVEDQAFFQVDLASDQVAAVDLASDQVAAVDLASD